MDFKKARKNMLDCQLATNGITDERVQNAFLKIPREVFLPEEKRAAAYVDEDIPLGGVAFMMEPMVHAALVQAAELTKDDIVLNIGDFTGYSSAILADMVSTVITIEPVKGALKHAKNEWPALDCCNIAIVEGTTEGGVPEHAPYSIIMMNGSMCEIPDNLLSQLQDGGRLIAVECKDDQYPGDLIVVEKIGEGKYSRRFVKNVRVPFLAGHEPKHDFCLETV